MAPLPVATPRKEPPAADQDVHISPLLADNPWICKQRGSSSSRKKKPVDGDASAAATAATEESAAAAAVDAEGSPKLRRRRRTPTPEAPLPPPTVPDQAPVAVDRRDAAYFDALVALEQSRLTELCQLWQQRLAESQV